MVSQLDVEAQAADRRVLAYAEAAGATQAEVLFMEGDSALTRFANSEVHQNVAERDARVSLRFIDGRRVGCAATNRLDDEALRELADRAGAIARLQPEQELALEDAFVGNAYESDAPRVPTNLYESRDLFSASEVAREAFGEEVVDHYLNRARIELEAHEAAVTDWDKYRGFERL